MEGVIPGKNNFTVKNANTVTNDPDIHIFVILIYTQLVVVLINKQT